MEAREGTRINKYLADKGVATRRGADLLVAAGRVFVNGLRATLGQRVGPTDSVEVRGGAAETPRRYFAYYKPKGVVTHSPRGGEKAIADLIQQNDLFPVGRLDKNSEGLIILTNDGRVTDRLLNPKYKNEREYLVTTSTGVGGSFARRLEKGVTFPGGEKTAPAKVTLIGAHEFRLNLTEGKRHEVKRMTEALGVSVTSLKRVRVLNITIGSLKPGELRELSPNERQKFLSALGLGKESRRL